MKLKYFKKEQFGDVVQLASYEIVSEGLLLYCGYQYNLGEFRISDMEEINCEEFRKIAEEEFDVDLVP